MLSDVRFSRILIMICISVVLLGSISWIFSEKLISGLVNLLEERFRRSNITAELKGIIVLIGGDKRLQETGRLARNYPHLTIVISGTKGMSKLAAELGGGIDPSRIILETKSNNTYENARYSAELVSAGSGERWLLVTGASHMPRAIGSFRRAHIDVEPWPVCDLIAAPSSQLLEVALREWIGLIVYRILGRTDTLFPAPRIDTPSHHDAAKEMTCDLLSSAGELLESSARP